MTWNLSSTGNCSGCLKNIVRPFSCAIWKERPARTRPASLRIPEGTLATRLRTARMKLARSLARHGVTLPTAALAAVLSQNAASASVPAAVISSAVKNVALVATGQALAAGMISAKVAALTQGVMKAMFLTKLKSVVGVMLAVMVLGGVGTWVGLSAADDGAEQVNSGSKATDIQRGSKPGEGQDAGNKTMLVAAPIQKDVPEITGIFTVTIKAQKEKVRVNVPFELDLCVLNSSHSTQTFQLINDEWDWLWKSNNRRVPWEPKTSDFWETMIVEGKLEPGKTFENKRSMRVLAGPEKKVSFRMGFTPDGKHTYWSNELTLQIEAEDPSDKDKTGQAPPLAPKEIDPKAGDDVQPKVKPVQLPGGDHIGFSFHPISDSGVDVVRLTPNDKVVWKTHCPGLGVAHSKYKHKAEVAVEGDKVRVLSVGDGGTFVEILDAKTGKSLERKTELQILTHTGGLLTFQYGNVKDGGADMSRLTQNREVFWQAHCAGLEGKHTEIQYRVDFVDTKAKVRVRHYRFRQDLRGVL